MRSIYRQAIRIVNNCGEEVRNIVTRVRNMNLHDSAQRRMTNEELIYENDDVN